MQALRYASSVANVQRSALRPLSSAARYYSQANGFEQSKLDNGVSTFASTSTTAPVASISVVVKAGPTYETHETAGASQYMKALAFKSTKNLSSIRVTRLLENHAASFEVSCNRDNITYTANVLQNEVPNVCGLLAEIMQPKVQEYEVRDQRSLVNDFTNEDLNIHDLVCNSVFRGQGPGRPLNPPAYNVNSMSHEVLQDFAQNQFVGSNISILGMNVNQEQFKAGIKAFSVIPEGKESSPHASGATASFGGEALVSTTGPTQVALAFPLGNFGMQEGACLSALLGKSLINNRTALGGGVTSRLYQNILLKNPCINTASSFVIPNPISTVFGISASTRANGNAKLLVDSLSSVIKTLSNITDEEANKAIAIASRNLPGALVTYRDQYAGFLARGNSVSPEEMVSVKVTPDSLRSVVKEVFSDKPTLAVIGDITGVPKL